MSAVGACRRSVGPENWRVFMLRIKELCIFLWCVSHSLVALSDAHDGDIAMRIDSLMASHFPAAGEPGAAILIKCGDSIIIDKGYGVADIVSSQPIDGNTMFNIASISKQFTVAGILSLADKGLLSVGDSVAKYMPEYESGQWKKIRLSHLMSHSSGVPDLRRRLNREQMIYATDEESVAYLDTLRTFHFEPGAAYEYVNPTFLLLGNIIERVSGEKFEEFQQKNIFGRAAMRAIYFSPDIVIPNMAHGYVKNTSGGEHDSRNKVSFEGKIVRSDSAWKEYDYGEETFFATKADGGIYTSTHDFLKWVEALESDSVISRRAKESAFSAHVPVYGSKYSSYQNRPNTWYGYGFFIDRTPNYPEKVYHTGDNGGFQNYAAMYPRCGVAIVLFANRNDFDRWALVKEIDKILQEEGAFETCD